MTGSLAPGVQGLLVETGVNDRVTGARIPGSTGKIWWFMKGSQVPGVQGLLTEIGVHDMVNGATSPGISGRDRD